MRRQLAEMAVSPAGIEQMDFRQLFRRAAEKGFVADPVAWARFREMYAVATLSHDENRFGEVLERVGDFLKSARRLLARLKALQQASVQ